MSRPNILLIVTDQEYAHQPYPPGFSLPNREKLRQRGISFDNYQVTTTLCTPSRACMYTGQHTPLTGMWDNDNMSYISSLSPDIPTLGHMLREAGYVTAYKGKWHLSQQSYDHTSADEMEPYGFADFQTWGSTFGLQTEGSHLDRRIGQDAADWILENGSVNDQEQPWFLAVNFINPHDIMFYNMGEEHEATMLNMVAAAGTDLYQQEWDVTLPASFGENSEEHPAGVEEFRQVNGRFQGRVPIENTKAWKRYINYYLNCYRDVDQHLGTVIDGLEAAGQLDNTVIIFTSDHGDMGGAHNLREKGSILFREVVNTPLIVSHPDGPDGQTTSAIGSALDLAPTILSLAGVTTAERKERHPQLKGVDLSDVILGHDQTGPRGNAESPGKGALYTYDNLFTYDFGWFASHLNRLLSDAPVVQMEESNKPVITDPTKIFTELGAPDLNKRNMIRGIFDGRYKLIRYFSIGNYHLPADVDTLLKNNDVALYDLVIDPHEMVNLARVDHPDYDKNLLATMNTKLNDLIESEIGLDENKVGI